MRDVREPGRITIGLVAAGVVSLFGAAVAWAGDPKERGAGAFASMQELYDSISTRDAGQVPDGARSKIKPPIGPENSGRQMPQGPSITEIRALLAKLRPEALRAGVSARTFDRIAPTVKPEPTVLPRLGDQPEFVRPIGDYVQALVSVHRVSEGKRKLADNQAMLARIEHQHGVPASVLVAIWGIESLYGSRPGTINIFDALATLAAAGDRRQVFWRKQIIAAMEIVDRGDVSAEALVGSWAGAVGHTQFIPTTYLARAVDFDGDGRRDMIRSSGDALASAANYLRSSGWKHDAPWGFEVRLPEDFAYGFSAPGRARSVELWDQLKVRSANGEPLPRLAGDLQLVLPSGSSGPAFLVTGNYRAILAYNNSMAYALAVGLLSDQISGRGSLKVGWPEEHAPLRRAEREELQRLLDRLGYNVGGIDGVMGAGTRNAIRAFQKSNELAEDGHPDRRLLDRLRVDVVQTESTP